MGKMVHLETTDEINRLRSSSRDDLIVASPLAWKITNEKSKSARQKKNCPVGPKLPYKKRNDANPVSYVSVLCPPVTGADATLVVSNVEEGD